MLTEEEKKIIEKLIQFHKNADGTVYPDIKPSFNAFLGVGYINTHSIIDKCVTLDLIKYKFPDRTGWTTLTKKGWEFTTFEDFDNMQLSQKEIDRITIDKLKADLINSRRQAKMFWPLTILTIMIGLFSLYSSINKPSNSSLKNLELKVHTTDSVLNSLIDKMEQARIDTSKHVSKPLIHE